MSLPRAVRFALCAFAGLATGVLTAGFTAARAQELEPRAYSNAPVGMNFLIVGYAYSKDGVAFDSSSPITNPDFTTSNAVLAYARALDLWGMSGKFDAVLPYTWLSGSADVAGQRAEREVNGFSDPKFRLAANFYGAPALTSEEFRGYEQDLIFGANLQVYAPWGQYDETRLVNIGTNRWSFRPEVGISKALRPWIIELAAGVAFFTDNREFYGGSTRSQDPLYSVRGHAIYTFSSGIWASIDATYFAGGRTSIDGAHNNDLQQNWRTGATLAFPVDRRNSIKLYASSGVSARTGNNYDLIGIGWQHRWGGGL